MSCAGYAEPYFDIPYFSIEFASRLFAIAKFTSRFYTVWAGSTQWGTRHIAAIEKFVVSANVGFLAQGPTHPIGHQEPFDGKPYRAAKD